MEERNSEGGKNVGSHPELPTEHQQRLQYLLFRILQDTGRGRETISANPSQNRREKRTFGPSTATASCTPSNNYTIIRLSRPGLYLFWMTRLRRWLCELDSWSADLAVVVVVAGTQSLHRTSYGQHTSHVGNRVGRHTGCKDPCHVHPHQRIGRLLFDHSVCMISLHFVNFCLNICCSGPSQSMC